MNGKLKRNYGFAFDVSVEEEKPFYKFIVFKNDLMDFWYDYEDMTEIKKILKEEGWKKTAQKTYENNEIETIYEKENKKMMFYHSKEH